jgi:hypothetical protein
MRQTVDTRSSKTTECSPAVRYKFVGRYARLRISRTAMQHTEIELAKLFRTQRYWSPIVVGDKGEVRAGIGLAQLSNESILGRYVPTVKYSEVSKRYIREYKNWLKKVARREKWNKRALTVELQYLQ